MPKPAFFYAHTASSKPVIAISACLAGETVRYDGQEKSLAAVDYFRSHFSLLPLCPEVGAGLGVPRPPVQLVNVRGTVRALGRDDPTLDVTPALIAYRQRSLAQLQEKNVSAYLFKSRSPSCGFGSTPLFDESGQELGLSSGLQAQYIHQHMPWLLLREETDLIEMADCERFLWLCRLSSECQQASAAGELPAFQRHYQSIVAAPNHPDPLLYRQLLVHSAAATPQAQA